VRHPGIEPKYKAYYAGVLAKSYLMAVGDEQTARARMQHMIDFANAALMSSGYYEGRYYLRDIAVFDIGENETTANDRIWTWLDTNADVVAFLQKTGAFGKLVALLGSFGDSPRNFPGLKIDPTYQDTLVGGFFALWDDGDIINAGHLLGHTAGMDHNTEDAAPASGDAVPFARGAYDCTGESPRSHVPQSLRHADHMGAALLVSNL
jgi:hypothetical protein